MSQERQPCTWQSSGSYYIRLGQIHAHRFLGNHIPKEQFWQVGLLETWGKSLPVKIPLISAPCSCFRRNLCSIALQFRQQSTDPKAVLFCDQTHLKQRRFIASSILLDIRIYGRWDFGLFLDHYTSWPSSKIMTKKGVTAILDCHP